MKAHLIRSLHTIAISLLILGPFLLGGCGKGAINLPPIAGSTPTREVAARIGFGSCIEEPALVPWNEILSKAPDIFVFLGDNIYLNEDEVGNDALIWARYQRLSETPGFRSLRDRVRLLAIWDDHDFSLNDSDSLSPGGRASLAAFEKFWRPRRIGPEGATKALAGIFQIQVTDYATLILTDNRTYRLSPNHTSVPIAFGAQQTDEIAEAIRNAATPFVIIASGNQILSESLARESLAQFPYEKAAILSAIHDSHAEVIILSGDRHYAEILEKQVGSRSVIEATSSPLAGVLRTAVDAGVEPFRKGLMVGEPNFGILTLYRNLPGRAPEYRIDLYGSRGDTLLSFDSRAAIPSSR